MREVSVDNSTIATSNDNQQCRCSKTVSGNKVIKWTAAGGVIASLGVCAACCLLPFALLSVGVAGVWVTALDTLAPYKWVFIALTVALLGYGFHTVYFRPKSTCATDVNCDTRNSGWSVRVGLWIATILAIAGIIFERIEPMLPGSH
jgi:mercuric ion transport protein